MEFLFVDVHGQDEKVWHIAAPTRLDIDVGNNIGINMTLFSQLLSFSKDGETFSLEDLDDICVAYLKSKRMRRRRDVLSEEKKDRCQDHISNQ